jgi:hypothetical protein
MSAAFTTSFGLHRIATIRHTDKVGWNDSRRWRYDNVLHRKYFAEAASII